MPLSEAQLLKLAGAMIERATVVSEGVKREREKVKRKGGIHGEFISS